MALSQFDRDWYKVPTGYDYFATGGPSGGFAQNISSAPDGTVFDLGTTPEGGLYEGKNKTQYYMKSGGSLRPVLDSSLYSKAVKVYNPSGSGIYSELNKAMGFAPYDYAITPSQNLAQSNQAYNRDLGTPTQTVKAAGGATPPTGGTMQSSGMRKLGPTEYKGLLKDNKLEGVSQSDQRWQKLFSKDSSGNIYLKSSPQATGGTQTGVSGQSDIYTTPSGKSYQLDPNFDYKNWQPSSAEDAPPFSTPTGTSGIGSSGGTGGNAQSIRDKLKAFGFSEEEINAWPETVQATLAGFIDITQKNYDAGNTSYSVAQAFEDAAKDPTILQQYGDAAKVGFQQLQNQMAMLQEQTPEDMALLRTQMQNQQQQLSGQMAEAGLGQSGIRAKAEQQLQQQQQGLVSSQRRSAQNALNQLGLGFESAYGSAAINPAAGGVSYVDPITGLANNLQYNPIGGITGTNVTNKQQSISSKAQDIYNLNAGGKATTSVL